MLRGAARIAVLLPACLALAACAGPGYYFQAASGQLKLMRARQDVAQVLADPQTDPALAARLQTAQDILDYAGHKLGMPADGSYSSFVRTGQPAVVWNVIAAPEFSLDARKWCFPVAGCVPYRGYFDERKAREFAGRMRSRGFDVSVQGATAYSTLGWFSDPLLDTMLQGDDARLAGTLFHELAHQRLYVKGDTGFSEAYASFVEAAGVRLWLTENRQDAFLEDWVRAQQAVAQFRQLQAQTRDRLQALYRSGWAVTEMRAAKHGIFDDMSAEYEMLVTREWGDRNYFAGWMREHRNNAALALYREYHQGFCAFEALFEQAGSDFRNFHRLAEEKAGLRAEQRAEWLYDNCETGEAAIAPAGDL